MTERHHIEIRKDNAGEWRWIRYAGNGEKVSSSSEGYKNKQHTYDQAVHLNPEVGDVRVELRGQPDAK